jgi:hypothetical protein
MIMKDKIIIILAIYFVYLSLFKERQSLGCKDDNILKFLSSTPPCDNANNQYSRIIREERPQNPFDVFERIVLWRKSFLLSIIIVTIYHLLLEAEFNGVKFMGGVIIGTFFIYFSFNFYKYHLDYHLYKEIMKNYTITPK